MITRIGSLVIKDFIHLIRDWRLPAFMLFGGVLELLLIGWATSRPITDLPLMVLDQDQSADSRSLVIALENTETFIVQTRAQEFDTINKEIERSRVNAALIIPRGFAHDLNLPNGSPSIALLLNGAESVAATAALRSVEGLIGHINRRISLQRLSLEEHEFDSFEPSLRVWFNESLSEALYTTPAELGLMLEFTVLLFASLAFSRERELGTLEQLLVMPFTSLELIIAKSIPPLLIASVDFVLMLGVVHWAFEVPIRGSILLLALLASGYLMVELGKGLVISIISPTQHQAFLMVMLLGMVDFLFTGYAVPVESMPPALQTLSNLIPAHHWLTILRGILLKGVGLEILWPNVLALVILGSVIGTFSVRFIRKALD